MFEKLSLIINSDVFNVISSFFPFFSPFLVGILIWLSRFVKKIKTPTLPISFVMVIYIYLYKKKPPNLNKAVIAQGFYHQGDFLVHPSLLLALGICLESTPTNKVFFRSKVILLRNYFQEYIKAHDC